jgi:hypothetical protein
MPIDNIQIVLRILESENHLLERADQKSISMLSILGVFMVFYIVYYRVIPINVLTITLVSLYFLFAILSIFNLIMAIRPRLRNTQADTKDNCNYDPTFFTGICRFPSQSAYKEALQSILIDESSVIDIYSREIYNVARINTEKYMYFRRGILTVIASLAMELVMIIYLFINYMGAGVIPPIF